MANATVAFSFTRALHVAAFPSQAKGRSPSTTPGTRRSTKKEQQPPPESPSLLHPPAQQKAVLPVLCFARDLDESACFPPTSPANTTNRHRLLCPESSGYLRSRQPVPHDPIPPELLPRVPARSFKLDTNRLCRNLRSSRRGAAGGPSGMTTEHLRPLLHEGRSLELFSCVPVWHGSLRLWLTWFVRVGSQL